MTLNKSGAGEFKGLTASMKRDILYTQLEQRRANQVIGSFDHQIDMDKKKMAEDAWAIQELANLRTMSLLDRANSRAIKEQAVAVRKENELKALEDKKR